MHTGELKKGQVVVEVWLAAVNRMETKSYENPGSPNKSPLLKKGHPSLN